MDAARPTEIKITIGGAVDAGATGEVDSALRTLGLDGGDRRWVWFLEDLTPGVTALPLLSAGVIVRIRLDPKNRGPDEADSTIKLRPARRSQLLPPWHAPHRTGDRKYRVEADWAGRRQALAASCAVDVPPEHAPLPPLPDEQATGGAGCDDGWSPGAAFTADQHEFLRTCTRLPVALEGLTCLGPVRARRWKDIILQPARDTGKEMTKVTAERWTVGGLDFLELSVRVDDEARAARTDFEAAVRATGLHFPEEQETKTRRVLQHLADRVTTG